MWEYIKETYITWHNIKLILFTNPSAQAGYDTRSNFLAEFNRFEFRVFPSTRLVASPKLKNLVSPTIYP